MTIGRCEKCGHPKIATNDKGDICKYCTSGYEDLRGTCHDGRKQSQ